MFGYGVDKKVIYIVLGLLVLFSLMSMTQAEWLSILLTLPAVIVAITFHEYAHAMAADKLGDTTPRSQGRLTLNPLAHLDPFGFILLMFAHIGWGKPVQVNPNNFVNSNKSSSFCEAIVSLAGPLMNFFIAIIACIAYVLIDHFASIAFMQSFIGEILILFLYMLIIINIGLGVFNLIPLPPLDGSKVLMAFLSYNAKRWFEEHTQLFYIIFLIIWITPISSMIISPAISAITSGIDSAVGGIFGMFN